MYNSNVRIGNWMEEMALEKEKIASFVGKMKEGKLLVQNTRKAFENLSVETELSKATDGFIKFGQNVQLKAPDMPSCPPPAPGRKAEDCVETNNGVIVAGTIHEKHLDQISSLTNDCQLIASPMLVPCVRNTFIIKSIDNSERDGENLLFGQDFALQIVDSSGEKLYVRSERPSIVGVHGPLGHDPVCLSNKKDRYSWWKVLHWDKEMRLETEGSPFPPFARVILRHSMSGLDLAVEGTVWWTTIFGNECGLSVHTYVNGAKRETAECLWMFVTRNEKE